MKTYKPVKCNQYTWGIETSDGDIIHDYFETRQGAKLACDCLEMGMNDKGIDCVDFDGYAACIRATPNHLRDEEKTMSIQLAFQTAEAHKDDPEMKPVVHPVFKIEYL